MKKVLWAGAVLATATAMLASPLAHAAAVGQAKITGLTFTLVDLNTADGITPWISFAGQNSTFTRLNADWYPWDSGHTQYGHGALHDSPSVPGQAAASHVYQSPGQAAPVTLTSYANGIPFWGNYASVSSSSTNVNPAADMPWGAIELSANTQLIVTGTAFTEAGVSTYSPSIYENAVGSVYATLSGGTQNSSFLQRSLVGSWTSADEIKSASFSLSLSNASAASMQGYFGAETTAAAWSEVSNVPEPPMSAMLAFGLLALAATQRRRR